MVAATKHCLLLALCAAWLGCKGDAVASDVAPERDAAVPPTSGMGGGEGGTSAVGGSAGAGGSGHTADASLDASDGDADMGMDIDSGMDAATGGEVPANASKVYVYVGTGYWGGGEPGTIATYELNDDGTLTFVERIDAGGIGAFMAADVARRLLYVADEGDGALRRYSVDPSTGRLTLADEVDVPAGVVHVSLDSSANTLLSASYDEGLVRVFALAGDGFVEPASDTEPTATQAHSIVVSPDDAFAYVCNKGAGSISQFAFDAASHTLTALDPATIASPGARHAAFAADGRFLYVVSELQDSVRAYARAADGTLSLSQEIERLPQGEQGAGAEVLLSPRGFLYASNRGPSNSIAVYAVDTATGALSPVEHEPTMGETPRNFAFDPDGRFLLVGNQDSQNLVVLAVDPATGALDYLHTLDIEGSPFFVGAYVFPAD